MIERRAFGMAAPAADDLCAVRCGAVRLPCGAARGTGNKKAPSVAAKCLLFLPNLVGANGLEPSTPTMSRWCSNQLSYAPAEP